MTKTFRSELTELINKYGIDNKCNHTPDFILAIYLERCLNAFSMGLRSKDSFYRNTMKQQKVMRKDLLNVIERKRNGHK